MLQACAYNGRRECRVDLPPEEAAELRQHTDRLSIDFIFLIAPTTPSDRIKKLSAKASGFIYYVSITGVTGTEKPSITSIKDEVTRIRTITGLPVVVGFGISAPRQARDIAPYVDGVVVGSAFVKLIAENNNKNNLVHIVAFYAKEIKTAIQGI
ncbi:MAG: tryptophan synthase subunit alpha [Thermodesulfobacteriota bacterium]|nr:tryptophan synthase subunit alpha [Thermodesulfobacteriota bacterium]